MKALLRRLAGTAVADFLRCVLLLSVAAVPQVVAQDAAPRNPASDLKPTLPDTDAGRCVTAFLEMVADPTPERVQAFETQYRSIKGQNEIALNERISRARRLRDDMGALTMCDVLGSSENSISISFNTDRGRSLIMEFVFDADQGGKLDHIGIQMTTGSDALIKPVPFTPDSRKEMVEEVAKAVAESYVYPELGRKMADAVLEKCNAGEYDKIDNDASLALRLTDDLRAISHDRHLGVRPQAPRPREPDGPSARDIAGDNFAFREVQVFPGNIGYIRFDAFLQDPEAYTTASAALAFVAHCDALIFDLRNNGGGAPESIRYITSYLFDKPTHLNDMIDREGKIVEEYWTLETVPGKRFAPDLPVFVLTSNYTFSGAEEFSYNLKNLKRATIVGETTGGGAHPVRGVRVNDRIVVGVPYMRACNPISQKNWEGVGVEPDVKTSRDEALDQALELARQAIATRAANQPE